MSKYVIQITEDNTVRPVVVPEGRNTLHYLQELVGGYIETVAVILQHPEFNILMLADEEGWIKDSAVNRVAASITYESVIFGNVVLLKVDHAAEDFDFFTRGEAAQIMAYLNEYLHEFFGSKAIVREANA